METRLPYMRSQAIPHRNERRARFLLFAFGLGSNLYVSLAGFISLAEVLSAVLAMTAVSYLATKRPSTAMKTAIALGVLWLLGAICADVWNKTELNFAIKGAAKVSFIILQIAVAYSLLRANPARMGWYLMGAVVSAVVSIYILKPGSIVNFERVNDLRLTNSFEKQWVSVVSAALVAAWFYCGGKWPRVTACLACVAGCLVVLAGSRSAGGIIILAGLSVLVVRASGSFRGGRAAARGMRRMAVVCGLGAVLLSVYIGYKAAAAAGWLGDRAAEKYSSQASSRFGLLFGGRSDFIAGLLAIKDAPLTGHGTWAADTRGYRFQASHIAGVEYFEFEGTGAGRIGGHSNLLEAWAEHGILAVPFWVFVFVTALRMFLNVERYGMWIGPLCVLIFHRLWDFFFSPIGGRTTLAVAIALFIVLLEGHASLRARGVARRMSGRPNPIRPIEAGTRHNGIEGADNALG